MGFKVVTASTDLAVPTTDLRDHVRGSTADDSWLALAGLAAQRYCEDVTGRSLYNQTFRQTYTDWPDEFVMERQPGTTSSLSIEYLKSGGSTWTAWSSSYYRVQTDEPTRVVKRYNKSYPSATRETGESVRLNFVAGYGTTTTNTIPPEFKHAIKLLVGHWYENRESVVVGAVQARIANTLDSLLWQYKWQ